MNNDETRSCGLDSLVEVLGGNRGVAQRLARMFLETYGNTLMRLDCAVEHGDLATIRRIAHDIRGTCAVFAAEECLTIARKIENDLTENLVEEWQTDCVRMHEAMEAMAEELRQFAAAAEPEEKLSGSTRSAWHNGSTL